MNQLCLYVCINTNIITIQACTQTFEKWGANLMVFTNGGESEENSDFEAKIRGVNSVSCEKLHDFEIIFPAGGGGGVCTSRPLPSPPPSPAYGPIIII